MPICKKLFHPITSLNCAEAGGSIPEPVTSLKHGYSNALVISTVCITLLVVLMCFWCWFLRTEYRTEEKNLVKVKGAEDAYSCFAMPIYRVHLKM
jgi:hypothetical protein